MPDSGLFSIQIDGVDSELHVLSFHGSEGMSQLFDFHVDVASPDHDIDFETAIGKPALVTLTAGEDEPRHVHGIVSRLEVTGSEPEYTMYGVTIVPTLWTLGLRQDACIFQAKSTPEIIKQVLEEAKLSDGSDFELRLQGSYAAREYCVQYRETDFAFISRLMEEDGLFYFFEHTDSGHKLVIADSVDEYPVIAGQSVLPFRHAGTGMTAEDAEVRNLRFARTLQVGRVELRAWNFTKTDLNLKQEAEADVEAAFEHYDYAGRYEEGGLGTARTTVRLEALRTRFKVLSGDSNCRQFVPGHRFTVEEHPRAGVNGEYVITRVSHSGSEAGALRGEAYRNSFDAIPAAVLFRAPQITPRGLVDGPQTAMVTGPSGEEIHVDSHGRVKVQFHWDRLGAKDDKSSCWVRVSQSHRIADLAIPRVGEEVIVDFLEGDPDQPIITGRVYNGTALTPYSLPADKTKSTFKTLSSPGGGGFNELRFEDAAGGEEIYLHAQKDWNIEVLNDRSQSIGHDHTHVVGHDETMEVKNDRKRKVGANESVTIGKDQTISIGGSLTESIEKSLTLSVEGAATISVGKDASLSVEGAQSTSISKGDTLSVGKNQSITVDGNKTESVKGTHSLTVTKASEQTFSDKVSLTVSKDYAADVKGAASDKVGKSYKLEASDEITLECGSAKLSLKKNGDITLEGGKINVKASSDLTLKGSKVAAN